MKCTPRQSIVLCAKSSVWPWLMFSLRMMNRIELLQQLLCTSASYFFNNSSAAVSPQRLDYNLVTLHFSGGKARSNHHALSCINSCQMQLASSVATRAARLVPRSVILSTPKAAPKIPGRLPGAYNPSAALWHDSGETSSIQVKVASVCDSIHASYPSVHTKQQFLSVRASEHVTESGKLKESYYFCSVPHLY